MAETRTLPVSAEEIRDAIMPLPYTGTGLLECLAREPYVGGLVPSWLELWLKHEPKLRANKETTVETTPNSSPPVIAMAATSDKKCDTCKVPIYKSARLDGKYYCWRCRRYSG